MKIDFVKIKESLRPKKIGDFFLDIFFKKNKWLILLVSLASLSYAMLIWYRYIYRPEWSEQRKQEYIQSKNNQGVVFNKARFEDIVKDKAQRAEQEEKTIDNLDDIFHLKR